MKNRCKYPSNGNYKNYGGRGIKVCDEWSRSFLAYYDYTMSLPDANKGLSLDRIDNNGNYEPGNVRWADSHTQSANKSKRRNSKTRYIGVTAMRNSFQSYLDENGNHYHFGTYKTQKEAVMARDKFIIDNGLTQFPLQVL